MRGSLVILAALCVIVVAEASSVRFVSIDEGQNGKDKKDRSEVSEGTNADIKKSVEDVVKKINDGKDQSEKTVERSSPADKGSETAGEGVKKSASSEKPKVQKRDVRKALELLAKRGMKRSTADDIDGWNIFNARKIIIKYLSLQKTVVSKVTSSLIYAVERLETDQKEKEALITALKTFQKDVEQVYDNTINSLGSRLAVSGMPTLQRKYTRADDIPAIITAMNQRNPLALIPLVTRLINAVAGAASVADMAVSLGGSRSNSPDVTALLETMERLLSTANLPSMPWDSEIPEY